jgi:hypothetical protein
MIAKVAFCNWPSSYLPDRTTRAVPELADAVDKGREIEPHYSDIGRPSVDPELMLRMLIVGYYYGIRSERRLCEETKTRRWILMCFRMGESLRAPALPPARALRQQLQRQVHWLFSEVARHETRHQSLRRCS